MGQKLAVIAALLLVAAGLASADALADQFANFSAGLNARVSVPSFTLAQSPQTLTVNITAYNPYPDAMPAYILRQDSGGWSILRLAGALLPNATTELDIDVEMAYQKETRKDTRYAVVARGGDGVLYGSYFDITEDWSWYETGIKDSLNSAIITFVPAVACLLVVLLALVARVAYGGRGQARKEYNMGTLLFPKTEGRPFGEILADVMINPITMLVEALCIVLLVMVLYDSLTGQFGTDEAAKIMLLSGIGAFSIPFIYFAAAWLFERREEGKPLRFFAGMFFWGMLAAFLSLMISSAAVSGLQAGDLETYTLVATMAVAPIVEETLKGVGVLFMSGHHEYNDTLTGLLLGFSCGAGFAFVENWFYFSSKVNPFDVGLASWGALIIYRSLFNTLAHGCFTAAISTSIGYLKGVERMKKFARLAFVPGLFVAVAIHTIFNLSALADGFVLASQQVPFFVFNPMLIILLAAVFFLVLVVAVVDEKRRAVQKRAAEAAMAQATGRN